MAGKRWNSTIISREAAFQDSLAQRARNKWPPKSALKARDNSARRGPSNIGVTSYSIPYVSFIERGPIPFQKQSKFLFERHCSVVFFLVLYVSHNGGDMGLAH